MFTNIYYAYCAYLGYTYAVGKIAYFMGKIDFNLVNQYSRYKAGGKFVFPDFLFYIKLLLLLLLLVINDKSIYSVILYYIILLSIPFFLERFHGYGIITSEFS